MVLGSAAPSHQRMLSVSGQELVREPQHGKNVTEGLGHILQCYCSGQASWEPEGWETFPALVRHILPPHRPGWLLRSSQGGQSSAGDPCPSDGGTRIEELL